MTFVLYFLDFLPRRIFFHRYAMENSTAGTNSASHRSRLVERLLAPAREAASESLEPSAKKPSVTVDDRTWWGLLDLGLWGLRVEEVHFCESMVKSESFEDFSFFPRAFGALALHGRKSPRSSVSVGGCNFTASSSSSVNVLSNFRPRNVQYATFSYFSKIIEMLNPA